MPPGHARQADRAGRAARLQVTVVPLRRADQGRSGLKARRPASPCRASAPPIESPCDLFDVMPEGIPVLEPEDDDE